MTAIIPLFDVTERLQKAIAYQDYERNLKQHGLEKKVFLFPDGAPENVPNGFIPQDACGGHQWNAHFERWEVMNSTLSKNQALTSRKD